MSRRWFRVRLSAAAKARGHFAFVLPSGERKYAPAAGALDVLARLDDSSRGLILHGADGRIEPLPLFASILADLRRGLGVWRGADLAYPGVQLFPSGSRAATRRFRKHIEASRRHDCAFDGALVSRHPEIVLGWPRAENTRAPRVERPRVVVALHLHYTELWDEFETLLSRWRTPFKLFVTLNAEAPALEETMQRAFPDVETRVVDNLGRDVRPFLVLLEDGALDGFDLVCKLHGKRSLSGGRLPAFGDVLRRANLFDLIADPDRAGDIVAKFDAAPELGLVGAARFLSASTRAAPRDVLGGNRAGVETLAARLGVPLGEPDFDFFEGTMFWARPEALKPIADLRLAANGFSAERGQTDGALEHACERLFNRVVRMSGFRVESTSSLTSEA